MYIQGISNRKMLWKRICSVEFVIHRLNKYGLANCAEILKIRLSFFVSNAGVL